MFVRMATGRRNSAGVLAALWAFATLIDLDKPFHVDDSFHLEMAEWVTDHPTAPMSGRITWDDGRVPMHTANQPPGFYYAIALTGHLFGYCKVPMHLMRSLFTLLAIVCFHRLARRFNAPHALAITALLVLGPAFLVNQGLMVDMPLLALHLLFFDLLLRDPAAHRGRELAAAGVVLSVAMMVKYTTAPLLVLFPVALILRKEAHRLAWCLVPLLAMALWSWWNLREFGYVHLVSRGSENLVLEKVLRRFGALICCLGALAPFTLLFISGLVPAWRERSGRLLWIFLVGGAALGLSVFFGVVPESTSDSVLFAVFLANGALLLVIFSRMAARGGSLARADRYTLTLWLLMLSMLVVVFAPTMGSRHLLLVLPPLLLICAPALNGSTGRASWLAIGMTAALGTLVTLSDKAHARFYREVALRASEELATFQPTWSVGLWGWLWYSRKEGMLIYPDDPRAQHPLAVGDVLVEAGGVHAQELKPGTNMYAFRKWTEPRPWWTFIYAGDFGSMYTSDFGRLPWRFDRDSQNSISAYRVLAVPAEQP